MDKYTENQMKIYEKLYFDKERVETKPEDVHERVAIFIGENDEQKKIFYELLNDNVFRPNTPCLIHAGLPSKNPHDRQLAACFVLKLDDSMESIIDLWATCSKIYASGAGAGFRITALREKGSPLSTGGKASGPVAYIKVNDVVSETVKSGGKHRRAANLGAFDYFHPDTMDIITIKENGNITSFNLSMLVDDWFMEKVFHTINKNISTFFVSIKSPNPLITDLPRKDGMEIWNAVIEQSWKTGDPGLLFFDNINKTNPFPNRGMITSTNPCGEVPLFDDTNCVIGSINIASEYICYKNRYDNYIFNWNIFKEVIKQSTIFLDNIIDKTSFLHPRFEKSMKELRPIGLGIMGFSDLLIKLNIEYGSKKSIKLFEALCKTLTLTAMGTSIQMCKEGKEPIPISEEEKPHFIEYLKYFGATEEDIDAFNSYGIRNCTWTCIAPTGSISISANCSYSFEPTTAIIWEKELAETHEMLTFFHPEFEKWVETEYFKNFHDSNLPTKKELINKIKENCGSIKRIKEIPEDIQKRFRVAHDIDPMDKIKMQAAGQRWISMGISSTCNLPNSATKEDIEKIYIEAWKQGLKGITVYRDGCKEWQPMNFSKKKEEPKEIKPVIFKVEKKIRPSTRDGKTFEIKTPYGKLFVTLTKYPDGSPMEVWLTLGGTGSHENVLYDLISKVISTGLQYNIDMYDFISQLRSIKEQKFWFKLDENGTTFSADSIPDAIGIVMEQYFLEPKQREEIFNIKPEMNKKGVMIVPEEYKDTILKFTNVNNSPYEICPECHQKTLNRSAGCRGGFCNNCGYTACS